MVPTASKSWHTNTARLHDLQGEHWSLSAANAYL